MIEEHLNRIRAAEEAARASVAEAESRATELVERSREEGEKLLADARSEAAGRERSALAAARRSAEERIAVLRADNAKRIAAIVVVAKKNQERAVDMIVGEFRTEA